MEMNYKNITMEELNISCRTCYCLKRGGNNNLYDLMLFNQPLIRVRNLGRKNFDEVLEKLEELGCTDILLKVRQLSGIRGCVNEIF